MTYEPVVCTLTTKGAAVQAVGWSELGQLATSIETHPGKAVVTFPAEHHEAIVDLAAREAECCTFLTLNVDAADSETRLSISSDNPDARPVIEALAVLMCQ